MKVHVFYKKKKCLTLKPDENSTALHHITTETNMSLVLEKTKKEKTRSSFDGDLTNKQRNPPNHYLQIPGFNVTVSLRSVPSNSLDMHTSNN